MKTAAPLPWQAGQLKWRTPTPPSWHHAALVQEGGVPDRGEGGGQREREREREREEEVLKRKEPASCTETLDISRTSRYRVVRFSASLCVSPTCSFWFRLLRSSSDLDIGSVDLTFQLLDDDRLIDIDAINSRFQWS